MTDEDMGEAGTKEEGVWEEGMADENKPPEEQRQEPKHRMRLPGFIADEEIGLGDVIKRATSYVGVKACGGCEQRAAALNGWMVFTRRHPK